MEFPRTTPAAMPKTSVPLQNKVKPPEQAPIHDIYYGVIVRLAPEIAYTQEIFRNNNKMTDEDIRMAKELVFTKIKSIKTEKNQRIYTDEFAREAADLVLNRIQRMEISIEAGKVIFSGITGQ